MTKLTEDQILKALQSKFESIELKWVNEFNGDHYLIVPADRILDVVTHMKSESSLAFDYLMNVSALDTKENLEVTYHLYSYTHRHTFILKAVVARQGAEVPTLSHLYGTAIFQEREVYDHFGVKFKNHPDMRRILLPDDWVGHPLLKDYQEQEEYNGIGTTRPSML